MKKNWFNSMDKLAVEIPVSEIMVTNIKSMNEDDNAQLAVDMMSKYSISGIIVYDSKDNPTGMVSEGDLIKHVFHKHKDAKKVKIKQIMSKELFTIPPTYNIGQASSIMQRKNISKLPVVKNRKIIGFVTKSDLLEKLYFIYKQSKVLQWLTVIIVIQFIIIAVLIVSLLS